MSKRRIDAATGEPKLTPREQRLVDEYIGYGGNGAKAAASAGYGAARPGQSAHQVLRRPEVQRRIRERIAESRVSADEIIGTLASFMRGSLGGFFDESGDFSIELGKQNGIDHLLKTVTVTTREIEATRTRPAQVVRSYRAQIHSPLQAASILARILGVGHKNVGRRNIGRKPVGAPVSDATEFAAAMAADFKVGDWLEDTIQQQMKEHGLSRAAIVEQLLQVRPEIAKYLQELPDQQEPSADSGLPDSKQALDVILDFTLGLATDPVANPGADRVVEACQQVETVSASANGGTIAAQAESEAIGRIIDRLSSQEREDLNHPQIEALIHHNMAQSHLTQAEALDAIRQQAAGLAGIQGESFSEIIEQCITDYLASQPVSAAPPPTPDSLLHTPDSLLHTLDSEPQTRAPSDNVQTCEPANVPTPPVPASVAQSAAAPTRDSGLQALDPDSNVQTCEPANVPTPPVPTPLRPSRTALAKFERRYGRIHRHFQIGQQHRFVDVIYEIMEDETLTPDQAIAAMRLQTRCSTWFGADRIENCIADYATLDPRLASVTIPPLPPPLRGIERYLRQPLQPPQPPDSPAPSTAGPASESSRTHGP